MPIGLEKIAKTEKINNLSEVVFFINKLEKLTTKKEIASALLSTLSGLLGASFSSFVEKENNNLKIICQIGEAASSQKIQNIFNKEMSHQLYDWVLSQKQLASLKLAEKEQFIFLPLFDQDLDHGDKLSEHGMLVFHVPEGRIEFNKELNTVINILSKLASLSMSRFAKRIASQKYEQLKEKLQSESKLAARVQKSLSGSETSKKILFSVLEDEESSFNGNIWWIADLGNDINLVLIAHVEMCHGMPAALIGGYLLGEMNSLKSRAEISLNPNEVLKHLNHELNLVFKNTSVSVNAWYGVFNIGARKVRFANANHPDPYLLGPEQQVSSLVVNNGEKGKALGINLGSTYEETTSQISSGSKLVICTQGLLELASKVGNNYDPSWLPQVLETLGMLPLSEMRNRLESILSENQNGTAQKVSRLALLLEIPS